MMEDLQVQEVREYEPETAPPRPLISTIERPTHMDVSPLTITNATTVTILNEPICAECGGTKWETWKEEYIQCQGCKTVIPKSIGG
jgi:tRNA(Ile2) C34 agmatinyltransferase TiaS